MTPAELEAIRARVEKATPGPWTSHDAGDGDLNIVRNDKHSGFLVASILVATEEDRPNAEFIAHARMDVPALLAHVAELREVLMQRVSGCRCRGTGKYDVMVTCLNGTLSCTDPWCARARRVLGEGE